MKSQEILLGVKGIGLALIVVALLLGMKETYTNIKGLNGDEFQTFLMDSVDRDSDYAGKSAYIQLNVPEYPDYLSMDLYELNKKKLADCKVLYESGQWVLIQK